MAVSGLAETDTFTSSPSNAPVSKWKSFCIFLYNSKDGTVLGRTGKSWLQIFIFYVIFYGVLAAFFAVLLVLFLQTLDQNQPKWQGASGIIGNVPGLGFRPTPAESGSTLIWVKRGADSNDQNVQALISSLNQTLQQYDFGRQQTENFEDCSFKGPRNPAESEKKKVCRFNLGLLGPCILQNSFGYQHGQPCVLLKLNKIYGWVPEAFPKGELPREMTDLDPSRKWDLSTIHVTCNGEDNVDKEHIGQVKYYPEGFEFKYYPYTNSPGYLSPVVMVQFLNPDPGVVVNVECKAWAKNIKHSRVDRLGQVHFEILVDN